MFFLLTVQFLYSEQTHNVLKIVEKELSKIPNLQGLWEKENKGQGLLVYQKNAGCCIIRFEEKITYKFYNSKGLLRSRGNIIDRKIKSGFSVVYKKSIAFNPKSIEPSTSIRGDPWFFVFFKAGKSVAFADPYLYYENDQFSLNENANIFFVDLVQFLKNLSDYVALLHKWLPPKDEKEPKNDPFE